VNISLLFYCTFSVWVHHVYCVVSCCLHASYVPANGQYLYWS
jgi:hypothetical protein